MRGQDWQGVLGDPLGLICWGQQCGVGTGLHCTLKCWILLPPDRQRHRGPRYARLRTAWRVVVLYRY